MRHRVVKKTLGRDKDHRKMLLVNLSKQLIDHESINTTLAKAKYLRPHIEKIITKARKFGSGDKIKDFNVLKELRKSINDEAVIKKLVKNISPRYKSRSGGYTRIIKTGERDGDKAKTARIELVKVDKPAKVEKKDENNSTKSKK